MPELKQHCSRPKHPDSFAVLSINNTSNGKFYRGFNP